MSKFTLTQHRKPWNKTAEYVFNEVNYLIQQNDINTIDELALRLRASFDRWCNQNKKNPESILFDIWEVNGRWILGIDKPNGLSSSALVVSMWVNRKEGIIIYGGQGVGKSHLAREIATEISPNGYKVLPLRYFKPYKIYYESDLDIVFGGKSQPPRVVIIDEVLENLPHTKFSSLISRGEYIFIFTGQSNPSCPPELPFRSFELKEGGFDALKSEILTHIRQFGKEVANG